MASLARLSLEIDPTNYELLLALLDARRFNNGLPTDRCSVDDTSFIASSTLLAEEDDEAEVVVDCDLCDPNMACKNWLGDELTCEALLLIGCVVALELTLLVTAGVALDSPSATNPLEVEPSPSPVGVVVLVVGVVVVVGAAKLNLVDAPRKRINVESPEVDRESNVFVNGTVAVRLDAVALAALTVILFVLIWKLSEVKLAQSP